MEKPKGMGGIGLRNIEYYNKAFLTKKALRIHHNPNLLIAKVMSSAYKKTPVEAGMESTIKSNTSWGYKGMVRSVQAMKSGFRKIIAAGNSSILDKKNGFLHRRLFLKTISVRMKVDHNW